MEENKKIKFKRLQEIAYKLSDLVMQYNLMGGCAFFYHSGHVHLVEVSVAASKELFNDIEFSSRFYYSDNGLEMSIDWINQELETAEFAYTEMLGFIEKIRNESR